MESPDYFTHKIRTIIDSLLSGGATDVLLVGGTVRDELRGLSTPAKDMDIEVYGLGYDQIVQILRKNRFHVNLVGKSFGTVKVDHTIDISIPRRESKSGVGHRGFAVHSDPTMTPKEAAARRDFTINSIAKRHDGTFVDLYNGTADIQNRCLRATSPAFAEDPLRVLRGMQFAARFVFEMEPATIELCKSLRNEFDTLSKERVWEEWKKWALLGKKPSYGLRVLKDTGWITCFPELAAIVGVHQNPEWHSEGDVFEHTCMVCDAAATIANTVTAQDRIVLLLASLCHDFGKAVTTSQDKTGRWRSPGHATASVPLAKSFLQSMRAPHDIVERVLPLVAEHMALISIPQPDAADTEPQEPVVRRLANRLQPVSVRLWAKLCHADALGCLAITADGYFAGVPQSDPQYPARVVRHSVDAWLRVADRLSVTDNAPVPLLQGRDLIAVGMRPGREMGDLLKIAFELQLDGQFCDHNGALDWLSKNHKVEW